MGHQVRGGVHTNQALSAAFLSRDIFRVYTFLSLGFREEGSGNRRCGEVLRIRDGGDES